jgi:hypothetical protein
MQKLYVKYFFLLHEKLTVSQFLEFELNQTEPHKTDLKGEGCRCLIIAIQATSLFNVGLSLAIYPYKIR